MLKAMRNNVKSLKWTLWLVILAFIGFIGVQWGAGGISLLGGGSANTILWIGGTKIDGDVFKEQLLIQLQEVAQQAGNSLNRNLITQLQLPERILQRMVYTNIAHKEADRLHLSVTDEELRTAIRNLPRFQNKDGQFIGINAYRQWKAVRMRQLAEVGINYDFEEELRGEIIPLKLKDFLFATAVVDEETLRNAYQKENDKVDLEYIAFKPEELVKNDYPLTEKEIEDFFNQRRQEYKTAEKRSGTAIVVKYDSFKPGVQITEKEMNTYFQDNTKLFTIPGKTKVSRILFKYTAEKREEVLKKAEEHLKTLDKANFAATAKVASEDEKSKDGGDWGYSLWQNFSENEKNWIRNKDNSEGSISPAIDIGSGFSIILVAEKIPDREQDYAEAKIRIRSILERQKLRELALARINQIFKKARGEPRLADWAKKNNTPFIQIPLTAQGEPIPDVDPYGYMSQALFSQKPETLSDPFEMIDGMAVVQIERIVPAEPQKLQEAKESVKKDLQREKKLDALQSKANELWTRLQGLKEQKQVDELLKKENLKSESAAYQRGDRLASLAPKKGLDQLVFSQPDGVYSRPIRFQSEVVIFKPKSKTITGAAEFAKNRSEFYQKKVASLQYELFLAYMEKKREDLQVRYNTQLYDKIVKEVLDRFSKEG